MTPTADALQHARQDPEFDLARNLRAVVDRCGKSSLAQTLEMWRLRFGIGRLQPDEYYAFGLYDDRRFTPDEKAKFLGRAAQDRIFLACNALQWWAVAHDKVLAYALLGGEGLPVPKTRALYHAFRRLSGVPAVRQPAALAEHLRTAMRYPCFGKPATGIRSVAVALIEDYRSDDDALILRGGAAIPVDAFVAELEPYRGDGYLFQELLAPHPELNRLCGPRLSTVRLILLLEADGPRVLHALWKVPVGDNVADNFWRRGNLLAALDAPSGRVLRVVQGTGSDQTEPERHPDTGRPLAGIGLPDWQAALELCLEAARLLPGLRMQAWDVALTDRGPVLVEVNIGGISSCPRWRPDAGFWTSGSPTSSKPVACLRQGGRGEMGAARKREVSRNKFWGMRV